MDVAFKLEDEMKFKIKIGGSSSSEHDGGSKPAAARVLARSAGKPVLGRLEILEVE